MNGTLFLSIELMVKKITKSKNMGTKNYFVPDDILFRMYTFPTNNNYK